MTDRVALVTGASQGIGAATARALAAEGYVAVLAARNAGRLEAVAGEIAAAGGRAVVKATDVTRLADLDDLLAVVGDDFGHLDVLVNNAGVLPEAKRADTVSVDEWNHALNLNLTAPWYLASRSKDLLARRGGTVINVTSTASFYPTVGFSAYNASKAGLTALTRTLALEWARFNIRVVGIAPGKIDTAMVQPILEYSERRDLRLNPVGRIGRPEEVADLICFLISDSASFITGGVISIDGGEVAATGADLAR